MKVNTNNLLKILLAFGAFSASFAVQANNKPVQVVNDSDGVVYASMYYAVDPARDSESGNDDRMDLVKASENEVVAVQPGEAGKLTALDWKIARDRYLAVAQTQDGLIPVFRSLQRVEDGNNTKKFINEEGQEVAIYVRDGSGKRGTIRVGTVPSEMGGGLRLGYWKDTVNW